MPKHAVVNIRKPHLWWDQPWTIVESCTRCSAGCEQCWSLGRLRPGLTEGTINLRHDRLHEPEHWRRPRVVFVLNDLFHEEVPGAFLDRAFSTMGLCGESKFIVLTKRAMRARGYLSGDGTRWRCLDYANGWSLEHGDRFRATGWPLPNVVLGVTCESNEYVWRVEELARTPAAVRFVNAHLLGPLDLGDFLVPEGRCLHCGADAVSIHQGQHWTGPDYEPNAWEPCGPVSKGPAFDWLAVECNRPFRGDPAEWWGWCESLVAQATAAGVPVWVKQGPRANGRVTHELAEFPEFARRREVPWKQEASRG